MRLIQLHTTIIDIFTSTHPHPISTARNDLGTLRIRLEFTEKERERERQQLEETIADLREDRDRRRQQATALLEDKRPRGFWKKLFGG